MLDHPKGATMRRQRLLVELVVVAVVVIAAACGGDSNGQADPTPDPATVAPTSGAEPVADRSDIERLSTGQELSGVRLGDRFAWCANAQHAWHFNLDALGRALGAVVDHNEAVVALDDAGDELDRAEVIEQLDELEERAEDLIRDYHNRASPFYGQIIELNAGAEGSKGVAYTRAREAFEAAASPQELTLLQGFEVIWRLRDLDDVVRVEGLPLSPAVEAAIGVASVRAARRAVELPSFDTVRNATRAVSLSITNTDFKRHVIAAAVADAEVSVYGHLMDTDLATAARAYLEASADDPETITVAYQTAEAASDDAVGEARSAAYDAAQAVFTDAVADLEAAEDDYTRAHDAAWDAASEATKAAIRDLRRSTKEARDTARASAHAGLDDTFNAVSSQADQRVRAARDATEAAADEALAKDTRAAAVESARASPAEGLAAAVVAEAVVNQFDSGRIRVHDRALTPGTFASFVVRAVAVESLIRSDAWAALQQSLAEACQ